MAPHSWPTGDNTSGVFTQTGGVNCPFTSGPTNPSFGSSSYNTLEVGFGNGGYGEYDMSGGSVGANCIYVGASAANTTVSYGTGVFTQTGGSVGRLAAGSSSVQPVGLMVGGNWTSQYYWEQGGSTQYRRGDLQHERRNTLFVGGIEVVGANGTGTFTQNGGSNEIVGGGKLSATLTTSYRNDYGALILGQYGTKYANNRYVGDGVGTYNLQSGLLDGGGAAAIGQSVGGYEVVGFGGTGIFNQSGGTNVPTSNLYVGGDTRTSSPISTWARGGSGVYTLTGGLLDVPVIPQARVASGKRVSGQRRHGQFNQSGGTNMTPAIYFGGSGSNIQPYFKDGPQRICDLQPLRRLAPGADIGLYIGATLANCAFNFTGGTLQAAPYSGVNGMSVAFPIDNTAATSKCEIDMNGQLVNLTGLSLRA